VFAPAFGALLQTFNPRPAFSRTLAIISSLVSAIAAVLIFVQMDATGETVNFVVAWIRSYSIHFALGVDGLNLLPMLITALIFPFLLISEWDRQFGRRGIHALLLLLECSILGALLSGDLFLLLFFLTLSPIPLYFLASIWGDEGRESSAFRMISVALVSGASLFFGILLIYHVVDPHTFLIEELAGKLSGKTTEIFGITMGLPQIAFPLIVFGLALRAPLWPAQGWFRKFMLKVPTTVGIGALLAGYPVMLTVFTRLGFLLFPETMRANLDVWIGIGVANLVFGALTLLQENDLRGITVSLSTVFVGFAMMGIGTGHPTGVVGSQFILFSSLAALAVWGFATEILRYRTRTYEISETRGVLRTLPDLGSTALISIACALGIPGTAGFIAFALLYMGYFDYHPGVVVVALVVSLVITGFLVQIYRSIFLGEKATEKYPKLGFRERLLLVPLVGIVLLVGFFPSPLVELVRATILKVLA
jgi:NADH-quinone oxidoreductase subunit M